MALVEDADAGFRTARRLVGVHERQLLDGSAHVTTQVRRERGRPRKINSLDQGE